MQRAVQQRAEKKQFTFTKSMYPKQSMAFIMLKAEQLQFGKQ